MSDYEDSILQIAERLIDLGNQADLEGIDPDEMLRLAHTDEEYGRPWKEIDARMYQISGLYDKTVDEVEEAVSKIVFDKTLEEIRAKADMDSTGGLH